MNSRIKNQIKVFSTAFQVLLYLGTTQDKPFIILTDINLPGMKGNDLKEIIDDNEYLHKN